MKLTAYILAADPAWIEASVLSYYGWVDRIVVSYDGQGLGWTGVPIDVDQCLRRLRAIDRDGKLDYRPGHFARPACFDRPFENDTHQRQVALDQARAGADWVLQLDTDEVIADAAVFRRCLAEADGAGLAAMNYPAIWLYARAAGRWYLEHCRRGWRRAAGYPGPLAVRADATVDHARRIAGPDAAYFHVDVSARSTLLAFPNGIAVDRVIRADEAVFHFSWVRSEAWLRRKFSTWGHARDGDWASELNRWVRSSRHPIAATLYSQLGRGDGKRPLRLVRVPAGVARLLAASDDDGGRDAPGPAFTPADAAAIRVPAVGALGRADTV